MAYAKLIAAGIGMAVLLVKQLWGVELDAVKITDVVVMVLTALGVWAVPNK